MELLTALIMLAGSFFMLMAGIGILRMPDLFLRMSTTAKAGTLGAGLMLLATAVYFDSFSITTRAIATIVFIMITTPVATHMIARAAYFDGSALWEGTIQDDLHGHYHTTTHILDNQPAADTEIPEIESDDFQESG
ncbi:MAG: monovalent cation/H(+) antiporter subunit G [Anaerolineae bacterium]|nr:monovalent cation/H(+) antiporter subunit G [Anaerolineae bacterium]